VNLAQSLVAAFSGIAHTPAQIQLLGAEPQRAQAR